MLRALRRLLRPGGRTAFHTIHTAPGLDDRERARAHRSGPWAVGSVDDPAQLLRRAGFADVTTTNQTREFREVAAAWIEQWDLNHAALVALHGDTGFASRQQERRVQLEAIDDGLLQRSLLVGGRPLPRGGARSARPSGAPGR